MREVKKEYDLDEEFHRCHSEGGRTRAWEADIPTEGKQTLGPRHMNLMR